jgi:serine/threonine-protein kinase
MPTPPVSEVETDLAPGTTVDGYQITGKIAEGGMASIYEARHPVLGRRAAIKVINRRMLAEPSGSERFLIEARIAHQIAHPNVVDVFGFGRLPEGREYFIMEWLEGQTLRGRIAAGKISVAEGAEILIQTCDALAAAHEMGIVHRDVKPDNIFLSPGRFRVKLIDFGVAKLMRDGEEAHNLTEVGAFLGTPHYCSPEQSRGIGVDERADVYSLGITAFEVFLGQLPFEGDPIDVLNLQEVQPPPSPSALWPQIPPELEQLLLAMLEKSPSLRPSLATVRATLEALLQPTPETFTIEIVPIVPIELDRPKRIVVPTGIVPRRRRRPDPDLGRWLAAIAFLLATLSSQLPG